MTANITLGDNYEIDEDGNGNLVIKDSSNNAVLTHTDGAGWTFGNVSVDGISALETEQATTTSSLTAKGAEPLVLSPDTGEGFGGTFDVATVQLDSSDSTTYVDTGLNANRSASFVFGNMDPGQPGGATVIWAIVTPFDEEGSSEGSLGSSVVELAASGASLDARLNNSDIEIRESSTGNEGNTVNIMRFRWF